MHPDYDTYLRAHHVANVRKVTHSLTLAAKVIAANTQNFWPIFKFSFFLIVGEDPHLQNFVVSGPKFTGLLSPNVGGIAVTTLVFQFWISPSVPKMFAIRV